MKKRRINIGIAEDLEIVRHGIIGMLKSYGDIRFLFDVGNGKELLEALKKHNPAIVLLDIKMPELGGIEAMKIIKMYFPDIKIIVISAYSEETSILEYVKLGANSFLPKNFKTETLASAIYNVYKRGTYFDEDVSELLLKNDALPPLDIELTERELAILKCLVNDIPYKKIALTMNLAEGTIDWYKYKLFFKTNSKDVEGLMEYAKRNKLV